VFTNDLIDAYIELKMQDVTRFRMTSIPLSSTCITVFDQEGFAKQALTLIPSPAFAERRRAEAQTTRTL